MGTIIFETDKNLRALLADELPGTVLACHATSEGACAAMRLPAADYSRGIYATGDADSVVVAFVIKGHGLGARGWRSVSIKAMDETMGPYSTAGVTRQILDKLTPIRTDADAPAKYADCREWALRWRNDAARACA